jgi:acetylornithine deacetylase
VSAAEQLRRDGESRIGLVFVVGEERGSDGARAANQAAHGGAARFLINGEPTDNRLGLATRGILRLKLCASGRADLDNASMGLLFEELSGIRR